MTLLADSLIRIRQLVQNMNHHEMGVKKTKFFRPNQKFTPPSGAATISTQNLSVSIAKNLILKNVTLQIPENKITCIIGPSGCGKSTLLKTFNRLLEINDQVKVEGVVTVGNQNIYHPDADVTYLRRKMGLLSQRPCPLPMSIFDNIAYGCRIHGIRRRRKLKSVVSYYLQAVGLWDEVKDRLHTPASQLSIGQQQRLCLARGLAVEPQFLLADEATSALDPLSSKTIEELFLCLKSQYTIVMVTHTLRQALRIADYVIFMYMGEVIEAGPAQEIFNNPQKELTRNYFAGTFS